jgi:mannose-6-phosphate isomerase-like protein (cupin superfamily)
MSLIWILDVNKDYVEIPLLKSRTGAEYGALNYMLMEPGDGNIVHVHLNSDDLIYIIQGEGVVMDGDGNENGFKQGDVFLIPAGTFHVVKTRGSQTYIAIGGHNPLI